MVSTLTYNEGGPHKFYLIRPFNNPKSRDSGTLSTNVLLIFLPVFKTLTTTYWDKLGAT